MLDTILLVYCVIPVLLLLSLSLTCIWYHFLKIVLFLFLKVSVCLCSYIRLCIEVVCAILVGMKCVVMFCFLFLRLVRLCKTYSECSHLPSLAHVFACSNVLVCFYNKIQSF